MDILETIIQNTRYEVEERKRHISIAKLEQQLQFKREPLPFKQFLLDPNNTGIIAEFKRKSPSKGIINDTSTVTEATSAYAKHGASAISILTDEEFFGGSLHDLLEATFNKVPLLRKDFIVDEYQLTESKAFGADVILLIAACLSKLEVKRFAGFAKNLGLSVLLEVHNEQELEHICDDVDVVGVNNRDLKTFTVDINRSIELSKLLPVNLIKISESGIDKVNTIKHLRQNGFSGFLVGEKFMKEKNPGEQFRMFIEELAVTETNTIK